MWINLHINITIIKHIRMYNNNTEASSKTANKSSTSSFRYIIHTSYFESFSLSLSLYRSKWNEEKREENAQNNNIERKIIITPRFFFSFFLFSQKQNIVSENIYYIYYISYLFNWWKSAINIESKSIDYRQTRYFYNLKNSKYNVVDVPTTDSSGGVGDERSRDDGNHNLADILRCYVRRRRS